MALYSPQVKCAGCCVLRDRESCEPLNGRMYGPCCAEKVRQGLFSFSCGECGGLFSEEDMVRVNMCRYCRGPR